MLKVGNEAPDFTLPDQDGNPVSLKDFRGQKVIVYFYPKDNTPGCTAQACSYRDLTPEFEEKNAVILGISKDSLKAHTNFRTKYDLPFRLLSDPEHEVMEAWGVWQEKKLYGKVYMGIVRSSFVVDENGILKEVNYNVKAKADAEAVLASLE